MIKTKVFPAAGQIRDYVYCYRVGIYDGSEELSVRVCPNGMPGLVFNGTAKGESAIKDIWTSFNQSKASMPPLFLHGIITELSTMNFASGPYMTIQVLLQPHVLQTLFGINAETMTNASIPASKLRAQRLSDSLLNVTSLESRLMLIEDYLQQEISTTPKVDALVQDSLGYIQDKIADIDVHSFEESIPLSNRQFNRRFMAAVGITPRLYIRIKRFNEAMRLIDTQTYDKLGDIAAALNYHDQSHFIRDVKLFSGITPKSISQKVNDFAQDQTVTAYYFRPV